MSPDGSGLFHAGAALICLAWALLTLLLGRGRHAVLFAACILAAALWAGLVALGPSGGAGGLFEVLRSATWLAVLLALCHRIGARRWVAGLALLGALLVVAALSPKLARELPLLGSLPQLALSLLVVLTAENLYRNASEGARWHVVLPCIALGGLAGFDLLLYADAALSRVFSPVLLDARAVLTAAAAPLLAVAALRDRRARREPPVSRQFVFHGATLMLAGTFLLGIGVLSGTLRHWGIAWASAAVPAAGLMALAIALSAASLRGRMRRLFVRHFFRARYDYRHEWLRCVATLSQPEAEAPADLRAIRALADPADSPSGVLLLREPGSTWSWGGGWNAITAEPDAELRAELDEALHGGECHANEDLTGLPATTRVFGPIWLVIPLLHDRDGLTGAVLLAPPRAPFPLGHDVFALLLMLGREVAMFIAERRAAEYLAEQAHLHEYAKRFAFVAHDVKTIGAQLTMMLSNAAEHMPNPAFQQDMLLTLSASAERIRSLIARLDRPDTTFQERDTDPLPRLLALAKGLGHPVELSHDDAAPKPLAMPPEEFDSAVRHLLENAKQATPEGRPLRLRLLRKPSCSIVEITDHGPGMSAEFVRDALFRPLATSRAGGSGLGAFQARELLRRCGGQLDVESRPGCGTTMRLRLPHAASSPG